MKAIVAALVVINSLLAPQAAFAGEPPFKLIKALVKEYAGVTGCADDELNPKLVTRYSDKANDIEIAYIALVDTDINCMGGSGTSFPAFVLLKQALGREGIEDPTFSYLKVVPELSEPVARATMPTRAITSIYQKNGQLFATGLEYGANDANCCPSLKTIYKINLDKKVVEITKDDKRSFYTWNFTKVKNY